MASEAGTPVELYIYDLTNGLATVLSPAIIGRQVEGVWHTSVVVFGREYFYGGAGITSCAPGGTQLGAPHRVERLGETFVPSQVFLDYIQGLATSSYTGAAYRLLEHNCNHFSDEVVQFLCGARVPKHIVQQPDVLPPPLRLALTALLDNLLPPGEQAVDASGVRHTRQASPEYTTLNTQVEEARAASAQLQARRAALAEKQARKERRREKKRHKQRLPPEEEYIEEEPEHPVRVMAEAAPEEELDPRRQEELRRRSQDPPIVYKDIDGAAELEQLEAALEGAPLTAEERTSVDELRQYLVQGEGSWVLGDEFLAFIGRVLSGEDISSAARVRTLRCLAACALRDDVSLVLHQDRRHHAVMNYAAKVDYHPVEEQEALALFMCNLFENISSSEWLLYISEWEVDGRPMSNIRATTKVCVHALLHAEPALRDVGTALVHNIATKEVKTVVFDEVCVELGMALLQLLGAAPGEEHLHRACLALARLAHHARDVPQLIALVGPDPAAFRGTSQRVDEQIDLILQAVK